MRQIRRRAGGAHLFQALRVCQKFMERFFDVVDVNFGQGVAVLAFFVRAENNKVGNQVSIDPD